MEFQPLYDEHARSVTPVHGVSADARQIGRLVGTGQAVLDVGCSYGNTAVHLQTLGNTVLGLEISAVFAEHARRRGLEVIRADVENDALPRFPRPFDVVVMADVLDHLIDPLIVLRDRIHPLVRPGGRLICAVSNMAYARHRVALLLGGMPNFGQNLEMPPRRPYNLQHKTLFTLRGLRATLREAGFDPERFEPVDGPTPRLFRWLGLRWLWKGLAKAWPTLLASDLLLVARRHETKAAENPV